MIMITKAEAIQIAKAYLIKRNRVGVIAETRGGLMENQKIPFGKREGETRDVWMLPCDYDFGYNNIDTTFINIDAETGKVLYTMGSTSCDEYKEEEGFE